MPESSESNRRMDRTGSRDWRDAFEQGLPDLSPFDLLLGEFRSVLAVGWLGPYTEHATGRTPLWFLERLLHEFEPATFVPDRKSGRKYGCVRCDRRLRERRAQARQAGLSEKSVKSDSLSAHTMSGVLWVPAWTHAYVAPRNLVHMLYDHDYLPPAEFVDAVIACPRVDSLAYHDAFRDLVRHPERDDLHERFEGVETRAIDAAPEQLRRGRCPYCEQDLRSATARQCTECGLDWHDLSKPVIRGREVDRDRQLSLVQLVRG